MAQQVGRTSIAEQIWEAWAAIFVAMAAPANEGKKRDSEKAASERLAKKDRQPVDKVRIKR